MGLLNIKTGMAVLKKIGYALDFKTIDCSQFTQWLTQQINYKQQDQIFIHRCQIRDIQKRNLAELLQFREKIRIATNQWQNSLYRSRLEELTNKKANTTKAIAGLEGALAKTTDNIRSQQLTIKLKAYQNDLVAIQSEEQKLLGLTPEKKALEQIQQQYTLFQEQIGLKTLETELQKLTLALGKQAGQTGAQFEEDALQCVQQYILPWVSPPKNPNIKILSKVKLGCARAELDYVIVLVPPSGAVDVLAIIEAKRNPNDIAGGFITRQENLAWFTGDYAGYDPEKYRTHEYRDGHFSKTAYHKEHGYDFAFNKESFQHFNRNSAGYFLNRLFFISLDRYLIGMNVDELNRLMYRISTDIEFDLNDPHYIENLLVWVRGILLPLQTPQILNFYCQSESLSRQIIFIPKKVAE